MSKTTIKGYEPAKGSEIIGAGELEAGAPLPTSANPDEAPTLEAGKVSRPPSNYMTHIGEPRNNAPSQSYGIENVYSWHRTTDHNKKKKKGTGGSGIPPISQARDGNSNNEQSPATFKGYSPQPTLQMYSSPEPISNHIDASQNPLTMVTNRQNPAFASQRLLQYRSDSLPPPQIVNSLTYPSQTNTTNFPQSAPQSYRPLPTSLHSPYSVPGRPMQPIPTSAYAQQQPIYPYSLPINPANVVQPTPDQNSDVFVASDPFRPHVHAKGQKEISSFDDIETPAPSRWNNSIPQASAAAYGSHAEIYGRPDDQVLGQFASSSPFSNTVTPVPSTPFPSNRVRYNLDHSSATAYPNQIDGRHAEQSWNTPPVVIPNPPSPVMPNWGSYPYYTSTNHNPWKDSPVVARPASPAPTSSDWAPYTSTATHPVQNNGYARPESPYKIAMPIPHIPMIVPSHPRPVSSDIGHQHQELQPKRYTNGNATNEHTNEHMPERPTPTAEPAQETSSTPVLEPETPDNSSSQGHTLENTGVIPSADSPQSNLSILESRLGSTPILLPPSDPEGQSGSADEDMADETTDAIEQNQPIVPEPTANHSPDPTTPDLYPILPDQNYSPPLVIPPREPWNRASTIQMPIPHIPLIVPPRSTLPISHHEGSNQPLGSTNKPTPEFLIVTGDSSSDSLNTPAPFPSVLPSYPPYYGGMTYGQGRTSPQTYSPWNLPSGYPDIPPQFTTKPSFWSNLENFFHWPFRRNRTSSVRPQHTATFIPPPPIFVAYTEDSEVDMTRIVVDFVTGTFPSQVYLHLLLRLPSLYFSRVARIFEEADLSLPEIKKMALETASTAKGQFDLHVFEPSNVPLQYTRLKSTWEGFIDSVMREWKTFNIISVLLLSAILTILQIESAAEDPITRYTAIASLICAMISLLFGCMYIIRFGSMRKTYKAAEWALEAKKTKTFIWWNVWVLLAMPAIWLTWSIVLYIACIMTFVWRTSSQSDSEPIVTSKTALLTIRIVISSVLGLGLVYGVLILNTFSRYGSVMDKAWKKRIDGWVVEKHGHTPHYSSTPYYHTPYTPYADASALNTTFVPHTPYIPAYGGTPYTPTTFWPPTFTPHTPFIPPPNSSPYNAPIVPDLYPRSHSPGGPYIPPYHGAASTPAPFSNDSYYPPGPRADISNVPHGTPFSSATHDPSPVAQDRLHKPREHSVQHTNATDVVTQSNTRRNSGENPNHINSNIRPSSTHSAPSSDSPHGHLNKRPTLSVPPPSLPPIPGTPAAGANDPFPSTSTASPAIQMRRRGLYLIPGEKPETSGTHVRFRSPVESAGSDGEGPGQLHTLEATNSITIAQETRPA